MNKSKTLLAVFALINITSCQSEITMSSLEGRWDYVKVENPYTPNSPDTVPSSEIAANKPYIQLSQNRQLVMIWGGKLLSHGTFKIEGQNISYTETMADGKKRTFPFYIKTLTDKQIVFETKEQDAVRVTAVRH